MKIKLSKTLGYCMGVRRAMDMAFEELSRHSGPVYSYGELIHNRPALNLLEQKGLKSWSNQEIGTVIIRAHGLPPQESDALACLGLKIRDATCPKVLAVQKLLSSEAERGRSIIIWGAEDHPEVVGLCGHAQGRAYVINSAQDIDNLPELDAVMLVAQTTQESEKWQEVKQSVLKRWPYAIVKNTICMATEVRQKHLRELSAEVDAMVIIGGKNSGNTKRLVQIAREQGVKTLAVETKADLDPAFFSGIKTVGIAAGASTSIWQIRQILQNIRAIAREGELSFSGLCDRILRAMVLSNIYAAIAMACLSVSAAKLQKIPLSSLLFSAVFFLTLGVNLLRDFTEGQTVRFNDPDRMAFMSKYKRPLIFLMFLSAFSAIGAASMLSATLAFIFIAMISFSLIYQFLKRPSFYNSNIMKHIRPLAKPAIPSAFWAIVLGYAPLLGHSFTGAANGAIKSLSSATIFSMLVVFGALFSLALMSDVQSSQGDRIFGRPTLTSVYGLKQTKRLICFTLLLWLLAICLVVFASQLPLFFLLLVFSGPVYMGFMLRPLFNNQALHGFRFEALMLTSLAISGLITMV